MITDLCPVDLLLHRAGRLHRHNIERPKNLEKPILYVMGTNDQFDFNRGSEMVYGKYYLIRTQYYLADVIRIPSDIPYLIQKVYGKEMPNLSPSLMNVYENSKTQNLNKITRKKTKAQTYKLDDPKKIIDPENCNLIKWLRNPDTSSTEETATAQVRDIQETIEVLAVKRVGKGYGTFKDNVDI